MMLLSVIDDDAQRLGGGTRIFGLDNGPDYRDPASAGPHDLRHVVWRDAADGDHRARRDRDDAGETRDSQRWQSRLARRRVDMAGQDVIGSRRGGRSLRRMD